EEDGFLFRHAAHHGLSLIKLVTPTTDKARLQVILEKASGFLYHVSVAGITGMQSASVEAIREALALYRGYTDLPIAVGFGIKTPEQAQALQGIADAVVIGSALVNKVKEAKEEAVEAVGDLVRKFRL